LSSGWEELLITAEGGKEVNFGHALKKKKKEEVMRCGLAGSGLQ